MDTLPEGLVSVIVPVHNAEAVLPHCLECITNQSYRNLEIILVDDGSTDSSGAICDEFAAKDPRCSVIHQANRHISGARNSGQEAAHGEFLFFPDADDYFHKDMIRLMVEAVNGKEKYDVAIVRMKKTWRKDEDVKYKVSPVLIENGKEDLIRGICQKEDHFFTYQWNKLYRNAKVGNLRSNEKYHRGQDYDFNLRFFLQADKAVILDNVLYYWFQWPGSVTKESNSMKLSHECRAMMNYNAFYGLTGEQTRFSHYFLDQLLKELIFRQDLSLGHDDWKEVRDNCLSYFKRTRSDFFSEHGISPGRKAVLLTRLLFPHVNRLAMNLAAIVTRSRIINQQ